MELATDEIALRKMDKEEKKLYGLTLINLLQTCETGRMATKMLCVTDDSKNMERRIKRIKNFGKSTHKKIIGSLSFIIMAVGIMPFIVKATNISEPLNFVFSEAENIILMNNEESIKHKKNIEIEKNAKEEKNTITNINVEDSNQYKIMGIWEPYMAEQNGKGISITEIYGSAVSKYGGLLILTSDGTFSEFIGAYSDEIIDDLTGTYKVYDNGEKAVLTTNNNETKIFELLDVKKGIALMSLENGVNIFFKKK